MQLSDIQISTRFKGNINGAIIQIVDIENGYAIWKDCKSGGKGTTDIKTFSHLQMERIDNDE